MKFLYILYLLRPLIIIYDYLILSGLVIISVYGEQTIGFILGH